MAQDHAEPHRAGSSFRPEAFGARGDGVTNDTDAFAAMAAGLSRQGGGTIALRRTTYLVGKQSRRAATGEGWAFEPEPIMNFDGLSKPLIVQGNGARLLCTPGLRYGTFDRKSGERRVLEMPNYRHQELGTRTVR